MPGVRTERGPDLLRAIVTLRGAGWTREDICKVLMISRRSYFYKMRRVREIERRLRSADDDA